MFIVRRLSPVLAMAILASLVSLPLTAADFEYRSDQKFANGLWMLTFETPQGQVRLNLPERMRQGGVASGTIELYPRGEGAAFAANLAELKGYTLRLDGTELAASSRTFRWKLPGQPNSRVELFDASGRVAASPAILSPAETRRPEGKYVLPSLAQRGSTFIVRGPFDGDFANTRVLLDGKPAEKIAESSDLLVVRNTADQTGKTRAVVIEGSVRQRAALHSFDMRLSAPRGIAAPGASMTVRLSLEGLEELDAPFQIALYNHRPEVASFKGAKGPLYRTVRAEEISAAGVFELDIDTAVQSSGQLSLLAAVAADPVEHRKDISWPPHTENVTYPPAHLPNRTWPPHEENVTFPPYHAVNVTFPPHTANVTYPPDHAPNLSWPAHLRNVTFPPYHVVNQSFPPHYPNGTWAPGHQANVTWPPHYPEVTFPPYHQTDSTWPPHWVGLSFKAVDDKEPVDEEPVEINP
jgi:hypothetical protein